jgi:hypothetical protein
MTGGTLLLGMLADLGRKAGGNLGMAQLAFALKVCRRWNRSQGLVRICMAGQALSKRFGRPMGGFMTAGTFRHDVRIIAAQRIIGMENLMAICTGNCLMPGTIITQPVIMGRMAAGTFLKGKRLNWQRVYIVPNRFSRNCLVRSIYEQEYHCQQYFANVYQIRFSFLVHDLPLVFADSCLLKISQKKAGEPSLILLLFDSGLFNQEMRIHVTVNTVGHFLVHQR